MGEPTKAAQSGVFTSAQAAVRNNPFARKERERKQERVDAKVAANREEWKKQGWTDEDLAGYDALKPVLDPAGDQGLKGALEGLRDLEKRRDEYRAKVNARLSGKLAPDLTAESVIAAAQMERKRRMAGGSLTRSFITGQGATSTFATAQRTLLGG